MNLASFLPAPKQQSHRDDFNSHRPSSVSSSAPSSKSLVTKSRTIPPYGSRKGWIPRINEDFGDGGAYPEIHVAQYPLDMGRRDDTSQKAVPLTTDSQGRIKYEAILNPNSQKQIAARYEDLSARKFDADELRRPDEEAESEVTKKTREALEKVVSGKTSAAQATDIGVATDPKAPTYIRYTPSVKAAGSNIEQRIIRMSEAPQDPLEPPKFKLKKVPKGPPSPPVPVMHSPPRKLTVKDQQDWKIPPMISNWKNNKGYVIPLDKRLAADGRGLQDVQINDGFAKLAEVLYSAEQNAREEVAKRAEVEKRLKIIEKDKKEEMLRRLAQEARMDRATSSMAEPEDEAEEEAKSERDQIREDRRRERERDLRMSRNKSQAARNAERDISERVALGQAVPNPSSETMYDQRLFNQSQGMSSGFGDEDSYNIYSKPLFKGSQASADILHRPKKDNDSENYGGENDYNKLLDTSKFKPDKEFAGAAKDPQQPKQSRNGPVEFETEADPFGVDEFLKEAKTSQQKSGGRTGHMAVSSGNVDSALEGGSKRGRIAFEESSSSSTSSSRDDKRRRG